MDINGKPLTIGTIDAAMKGNDWWLAPESEAAQVVQLALAAGYLRRASHTQIEWTEAGLAKARAELKEEVRMADEVFAVLVQGPYPDPDLDVDHAVTYLVGPFTRKANAEGWAAEHRDAIPADKVTVHTLRAPEPGERGYEGTGGSRA